MYGKSIDSVLSRYINNAYNTVLKSKPVWSLSLYLLLFFLSSFCVFSLPSTSLHRFPASLSFLSHPSADPFPPLLIHFPPPLTNISICSNQTGLSVDVDVFVFTRLVPPLRAFFSLFFGMALFDLCHRSAPRIQLTRCVDLLTITLANGLHTR